MTPDRRGLLATTEDLGLWFKFFAAGALVCELSLLVLGSTVQQQVVLVAIAFGCLLATIAGVAILGADTPIGRLVPAICGLAGLAVAGIATRGLSPSLGGFFVLTFVYVGLTQPAWTSIVLVPLASIGWLMLNRPITHSILARLPVAVSLWILLGEMLSRFGADRESAKRLLAQQATHDALTGLRNRHGLDQLLNAARGGDAIAFIDLDRFKQLNDLSGHESGDRALADLGAAIREVLRADDVAVRYGGEEILLLLPATSTAEAVALTRRLREAWRSSHPEVTFSAGVAAVGAAGGADATRQADSALYLAKERGRDRTESSPSDAVIPLTSHTLRQPPLPRFEDGSARGHW